MQKIVIISGPDGSGKAEKATELVNGKAVLWIDFKTKSVGPIPDEKEKPLAMVIEGVSDAESILQILSHYNNIDIVIITELQDVDPAQLKLLTGKEIEMVKVPDLTPVVKEGQVCMENGCKKLATKDYNGYGHWVCDSCYETLSRFFDEEYN